MSFLEFQSALRELPLGGFRFFDSIGSTNDAALEWASSGAPDLSLVLADEQIRGRGRENRKWFTFPGSSLAFTIILRPTASEQTSISRFSALGALALVNVLRHHNLLAQIKWPNDVLINQKKVAGILVEAAWLGSEISSLVIGMGINVLKGSLPPDTELNFPATTIENELGIPVSRFELLRDTLSQLIGLRDNIAGDVFFNAWQEALAFKGERVRIFQGSERLMEAELLGLENDGGLRVRVDDGGIQRINFGEVNLRQAR